MSPMATPEGHSAFVHTSMLSTATICSSTSSYTFQHLCSVDTAAYLEIVGTPNKARYQTSSSMQDVQQRLTGHIRIGSFDLHLVQQERREDLGASAADGDLQQAKAGCVSGYECCLHCASQHRVGQPMVPVPELLFRIAQQAQGIATRVLKVCCPRPHTGTAVVRHLCSGHCRQPESSRSNMLCVMCWTLHRVLLLSGFPRSPGHFWYVAAALGLQFPAMTNDSACLVSVRHTICAYNLCYTEGW